MWGGQCPDGMLVWGIHAPGVRGFDTLRLILKPFPFRVQVLFVILLRVGYGLKP